METEDKKFVINIPEGTCGFEAVIREGEAVKPLEPKAPVKTDLSGVIGAPVEYLEKRVNTNQFTQERSHLIVEREQITLTLIINEDDDYLRGKIEGKLEFHPKFEAFGINTGKIWAPSELGMFCKMNRSFFTDKAVNMKLVTDLMNFTAIVNHKIEQGVKENGNQTDKFEQTVNSNLPEKFTMTIPIFKGMPAETLEVETFAKINGREVSFMLISPGANQTLEEIRDKAIDRQLERIREIAPNIAIIEK
ncbi:MAG: hypothetical protein FWF53_07115 [Candidatus Azobacteroides sp.]|nr:hypothetical protein [Candidatus Azobacteroides sp.]